MLKTKCQGKAELLYLHSKVFLEPTVPPFSVRLATKTPNPTWTCLVTQAKLGRVGMGELWSGTDISSSVPSPSSQEKLCPVCITSASVPVTVTVPASWQGYKEGEGVWVQAGQQAWF